MIDKIKINFKTKFDLPVSYKENENFLSFITDTLNTFDQFIEDNILSLPSDLPNIDKIIGCSNSIRISIKSIKQAIKEYYDGRPDIAYDIFQKILVDLLQFGNLPEKNFHRESFYRIRVGENIINRKDVFHIPFSKRTLVAPQRYSIAGYPCLYLANSAYVAWEEFHRPSIETIYFAKLTFTKSVNFINFSPLDFNESLKNATDLFSFFQKITLYPILLACSVKVVNPDNPFKPEYIFSQFTLRWCKDKNQFDGIMYGSTRVNNKSIGRFYNFAIPVSDYNDNTDLCPNLTKKILLTEPYNIKKIEDDEKKSIKKDRVKPITNGDISKIFSKELHKVVSFDQSIFAKIEYHLESRELGSVTRT